MTLFWVIFVHISTKYCNISMKYFLSIVDAPQRGAYLHFMSWHVLAVPLRCAVATWWCHVTRDHYIFNDEFFTLMHWHLPAAFICLLSWQQCIIGSDIYKHGIAYASIWQAAEKWYSKIYFKTTSLKSNRQPSWITPSLQCNMMMDRAREEIISDFMIFLINLWRHTGGYSWFNSF